MMDLEYKFATTSRLHRSDANLMVMEGSDIRTTKMQNLDNEIGANSVLVVNDVATIPGSFPHMRLGSNRYEVRLIRNCDPHYEDITRWKAIVYGPGTWHTPTEYRPKPKMIQDQILRNQELEMRIVTVDETHENLVEIEFLHNPDEIWRMIYKFGKPIQYSHLSLDLNLWDTQTIFSSIPGALEPPSASFQFTWDLVDRFLEKGVEVIPITHFTSISSTGVLDIDQRMPLDEIYRLSDLSEARLNQALVDEKEIIAVGTSVTRALEDQYRRFGQFVSGSWQTSLRLSPEEPTMLVNWLITGMHLPTESHIDLLQSFTSKDNLERGYRMAVDLGFLWHEYGDVCLLRNEHL